MIDLADPHHWMIVERLLHLLRPLPSTVQSGLLTIADLQSLLWWQTDQLRPVMIDAHQSLRLLRTDQQGLLKNVGHLSWKSVSIVHLYQRPPCLSLLVLLL